MRDLARGEQRLSSPYISRIAQAEPDERESGSHGQMGSEDTACCGLSFVEVGAAEGGEIVVVLGLQHHMPLAYDRHHPQHQSASKPVAHRSAGGGEEQALKAGVDHRGVHAADRVIAVNLSWEHGAAPGEL